MDGSYRFLWNDHALQSLYAELPFATLLAVILVAIAVLSKGADWMVDGVVDLARRTGIPRIVIGAAAVTRPLAIPPNFFLFHFPVMLLILASFRLFVRLNRSGTFSHGQGAWLLSIYLGYLVLLYRA